MGWFDLSGSGERLPQNGPQPLPTPETPKPQPVPYRRRERGLLGWLRDALSGWLGPKRSAGTPAEHEVVSEHVRSGPAGVVLPWFAPYADEYTGETPGMRIAYRRMWADPNVKAAVLGKILSVCALDLNVIPADKKKCQGKKGANKRNESVADFVRWNLTERIQGCLPEVAWAILSGGLTDGYSVCEKVWHHETMGEHAGKYVLLSLKPKDVGKDVALETDEFRNVVGVRGLRYSGGEVYSPAHFVIYRHLSLYNSPVGMSDFRAAYGRWWMLDTVLKLRAMGLEKRAVPVLLGEYETTAQKPSLEAALALARSQVWLSVPKGVQVKALEIAGAADAMFSSAVADLKEDLFLAIAGATLQALVGQEGAMRGSSKVHEGTADLFRWHLARALEVLLNDRDNGLIRDLVDLNFVADRYPRAVLSAIDPQEQLVEAQLDQSLIMMGLSLSKSELYEKYGRTPPDDPEDALGPPQPPGGAPGGPAPGGVPPELAGLLGGGGPEGGGPPPGEPPPPPPGAEFADAAKKPCKCGTGVDCKCGPAKLVDDTVSHFTRQGPARRGPKRMADATMPAAQPMPPSPPPMPQQAMPQAFDDETTAPPPPPVPPPDPVVVLPALWDYEAALARHRDQFRDPAVEMVHEGCRLAAVALGLDPGRVRELARTTPAFGGDVLANVRAAYREAIREAAEQLQARQGGPPGEPSTPDEEALGRMA